MIAALYVMPGGPYYGLPDVEPWGLPERDARDYAGSWPVVAHPPCERWGRYWSGGPSARVRRQKGDDAGCFKAALASVREWGGVLEHPEGSWAWRFHGLVCPPKTGGWVAAGDGIGWTCCVEQGHYGHRARKATWLYAAHVRLPSLKWGRCGNRVRLEEGHHSTAERKAARLAGVLPIKRLSVCERSETPLAFRDLLIGIAESANPGRAQEVR